MLDQTPQKSLTYKEAAILILRQAERPLHVNEIVRDAIAQRILEPGGRTPEATMGATIYSDIKQWGASSPFFRARPSTFGLREWQEEAASLSVENQPIEQQLPKLENTPLRIVDEVTTMTNELRESQHDSEHSRRFEEAIGKTFAFLGFDVKIISGAGNTDVLLTAYLGSERYRVIVDAKSSRHPKIQDSQIDWLSIDGHAKQNNARHIAIVAPEYSGGHLRERAEQYKAALITTENLCHILQLHDKTPFTLFDLQQIFLESGPITQSLVKIEQISLRLQSHWKVLLEVVRQIDAYNRARPEGMTAQADNLHYMLISRFGVAETPSVEEIQDALTFLSSRAIGVLRQTDTRPGYILTMALETAIHRINGLARLIGEFANQSEQE